MQSEPQPQHAWLQKLVGEWTCESEIPGKPGEPPMMYSGTESVRWIGRLWVVAEGRGEHDGKMETMVTTLGYDSRVQHYVGTWFGSMMDTLWVYKGELDESQRALSLHCEGPSMDGSGTVPYKDVIAFESDDVRTLTGFMQTPDGGWQQLMQIRYRRQA